LSPFPIQSPFSFPLPTYYPYSLFTISPMLFLPPLPLSHSKILNYCHPSAGFYFNL
jgi:hypothetical protein